MKPAPTAPKTLMKLARSAGTLPAVGFMGPTLLWLSRHDPALLARVYRFVHPKDYIRLKMTGDAATDVSDAAASGLFDVGARHWATEIISPRRPARRAIFPPVLDSPQVAGTLRAEAAAETGLASGHYHRRWLRRSARAGGRQRADRAGTRGGHDGQRRAGVHAFPHGWRAQDRPRLHVFNHAAPEMGYVLGARISSPPD